jgi:hypothetical protein
MANHANIAEALLLPAMRRGGNWFGRDHTTAVLDGDAVEVRGRSDMQVKYQAALLRNDIV